MADMLSPVRCCHCYRVYDLCAVKVVQRYMDCTVFMTPCCNRQADDRGPGWSSVRHYEHISQEEAAQAAMRPFSFKNRFPEDY